MSALHKPERFFDGAKEWPSGADRAVSLRLVNLSPSGFSACDEGAFETGALISLVLPGLGPVRAEVGRCGEGRVEGRFLDRDPLRLRFLNGLRSDAGDPRSVPAITCDS